MARSALKLTGQRSISEPSGASKAAATLPRAVQSEGTPMNQHVDRRSLSAAAAMMAPAIAPPMAEPRSASQTSMSADSQDDHPDAALILLGEQLKVSWAAENLSLVKSQTQPYGAGHDDNWERLYEASSEIVDRIEGIPAWTLEGLKVKAQATLWCCGNVDGIDPGYKNQDTTDKRLTKQILLSLLMG